MDVLCPFCNSDTEVWVRTRDYNARTSDEWFSYYRCHSCGLRFLWPVPTNIKQYYPSQYPPHQVPASKCELTARAKMFACRMKNIPPPFGKSRLLEIGASYGLFAYLALQSGYSVEAVEMNSECCRFLRSELDVNVMETSDVFSAMKTLKEYEVIALWQVFEHLSEPWKALDAFIKHLSEGGRIVIAVPDPDSLQFDLTGRYWMHLDAPRHLAFFPEEWFRRYAEERNMVITNVVRHDAEIEAHSGIGWVQSIRNILPSPWSYYAGGVLGYMIKWAMGPICRRTQRSCVFTVVMQSKKHKTEKIVAANE